MPSWDTIVEMLYDKHLDAFADEADIVLILGKDDDSVVAYSAIADRHIREASNI